MHIVIRLFKRGVSHIAHEIRKHGNDIFFSLAQRAILAHAKWCRKSYGLGLISPSRLSPAASHIFLKLNGIDDADMILPLGPGKNILV